MVCWNEAKPLNWGGTVLPTNLTMLPMPVKSGTTPMPISIQAATNSTMTAATPYVNSC